MKLKYKILIIVAIIIISLTSGFFINKAIANINSISTYKECKSIAVINKSFYSVYGTAKENDTNYKYYYKSIKIKETEKEYIVVLVDWETETEQKEIYDKSKYVVIVSY